MEMKVGSDDARARLSTARYEEDFSWSEEERHVKRDKIEQ